MPMFPVQPKVSTSSDDTMQIFVKTLKGETTEPDEDVLKVLAKLGVNGEVEVTEGMTITLNVKATDTMDDLKDNILDKKGIEPDQVEELRLIYNGKQINNGTLRSYGVEKESTLHMILRLRGGAKKGVKKILKAEKVSVLKATAHYKATMAPLSSHATIGLIVNDPNYIGNKLNTMTMDKLEQLHAAAENITTVRDTTVVDAVTPFLVPLAEQIQNQIDDLTKTMEALQSAVHHALAVEHYTTSQYDFDSFFSKIETRLNDLREEQQRTERQQLLEREREAMRAEIQAELTQRAVGGAPPLGEQVDMQD